MEKNNANTIGNSDSSWVVFLVISDAEWTYRELNFSKCCHHWQHFSVESGFEHDLSSTKRSQETPSCSQ